MMLLAIIFSIIVFQSHYNLREQNKQRHNGLTSASKSHQHADLVFD